jgi:hypothetical protein
VFIKKNARRKAKGWRKTAGGNSPLPLLIERPDAAFPVEI